jgi:hypothetical protein
LRAIAEYILANPVRKGLVPSVDEWPWRGCFTPLPLGPAQAKNGHKAPDYVKRESMRPELHEEDRHWLQTT